MTNGWVDIKNTDMMLIMGGNPAENHPCGFKWVVEAKRNRDAKVIVVDPRFTRTASQADQFLQIRVGSDIAFLGGLINYALTNNRFNHEYLVNYTNAAFIVKEGFKLPEDGLYSGYDASARSYDKSTWNYEEIGGGGAQAKPPAGAPAPPPALPPNVAYDLSLQNPQCVFQLLKKQYSRYTPEMVERITGIPKDQATKAWDTFTSIRRNGDMKKAGTIIYAVGWTQHSSGTQTIRTAAMVQLLLGNVGRAGGGVNALRGHSNIQGATDLAGIFDILPGYLKMPTPADTDLQAYLKRTTPKPSKPKEWDSFNYWSNTPAFTVSLLKALYGDAATKQNDFAFNWLPKIDRKYSWAEIWDDMYNGKVKAMMAFGMNGVMIGPNSTKNIDALKKADFLVVCEIYPDETSEFWRAPGTTPEEMQKINTTVYRLPGAGFAEKDGTFVNSERWLQWKWAAVPPPGECKLDQEILARIFLKVREKYEKEGGKFPDPILKLSWNYVNPQNPSLSEVAKEINGKALADVTDQKTNTTIKADQQLPGFAFLRDDGSTMSGNWLYCGSWTEAGAMMQRRNPEDPSGLGIHPGWAWSWPMNRRVLY
ncbi:MAG TPA: molybdopterin-dependent oxidoreductase, partial [Blastocatellia bacterium]|nr:molybdopterin-dependent oxidoreductase [Blastocatellia bacterium]